MTSNNQSKTRPSSISTKFKLPNKKQETQGNVLILHFQQRPVEILDEFHSYSTKFHNQILFPVVMRLYFKVSRSLSKNGKNFVINVIKRKMLSK